MSGDGCDVNEGIRAAMSAPDVTAWFGRLKGAASEVTACSYKKEETHVMI